MEIDQLNTALAAMVTGQINGEDISHLVDPEIVSVFSHRYTGGQCDNGMVLADGSTWYWTGGDHPHEDGSDSIIFAECDICDLGA